MATHMPILKPERMLNTLFPGILAESHTILGRFPECLKFSVNI